MAAQNNHASAVKALIEGKADVNRRNKSQGIPLVVATWRNNIASLKELLKAPDIKLDRFGGASMSALMIGCQNKHIDGVKLLIEAKASLDVKSNSNDRSTAMHLAAAAGAVEIMKVHCFGLFVLHFLVFVLIGLCGAAEAVSQRCSCICLCASNQLGSALTLKLLKEAGADDSIQNLNYQAPADVLKGKHGIELEGFTHGHHHLNAVAASAAAISAMQHHGSGGSKKSTSSASASAAKMMKAKQKPKQKHKEKEKRPKSSKKSKSATPRDNEESKGSGGVIRVKSGRRRAASKVATDDLDMLSDFESDEESSHHDSSDNDHHHKHHHHRDRKHSESKTNADSNDNGSDHGDDDDDDGDAGPSSGSRMRARSAGQSTDTLAEADWPTRRRAKSSASQSGLGSRENSATPTPRGRREDREDGSSPPTPRESLSCGRSGSRSASATEKRDKSDKKSKRRSKKDKKSSRHHSHSARRRASSASSANRSPSLSPIDTPREGASEVVSKSKKQKGKSKDVRLKRKLTSNNNRLEMIRDEFNTHDLDASGYVPCHGCMSILHVRCAIVLHKLCFCVCVAFFVRVVVRALVRHGAKQRRRQMTLMVVRFCFVLQVA